MLPGDTNEAEMAALIAQWLERRRQGEPISIDQLCCEYPHLRESIAQILGVPPEKMDDSEATIVHQAEAAGDSRTTLPPPPVVKPNPLRFGFAVPGYDIHGELGRGGLAVVYRARQQSVNRDVALKMVRPGGESRTLRTEATVLAALNHPNIIQIYDAVEGATGPYLSLELCPGGTLAETLRQGPMTGREAATVLKTVAEAVGTIHRAEFIHRDLKPQTIFWAGQIPKVGGFALSRSLTQVPEWEVEGSVVGTPNYMAPEQVRGDRDIGTGVDIWALGATLYQCVTGKTPFKDDSFHETLMRLLEGEPTPPRALVPGLSRDLEAIILTCLRKDPAARYATADDLAADLGRFLNDEPVHARPVAWPVRVLKWARRRPVVAALLAVVVLQVVLAVLLAVRP